MNKNIQVDTKLDSETVHIDPRIQRILSSAIRARGGVTQNIRPNKNFWGPSFFALDKVGCFCRAQEGVQNNIIEEMCQSLLEEAYYIERIGISFCAKMTLLADRLEERKLYSFFASDEAMHLELISSQMKFERRKSETQPFLKFLANVVENGNRMSLIYVVQILLEGWGIFHYNRLAKGCRDLPMKKILMQILRDETRHHGSGLALFDENEMTKEEFEENLEILVTFFEMVKAGPTRLMNCLEKYLGPLTKTEGNKVLNELNAEQTIHQSTAYLLNLISTKKSQGLVNTLNTRLNV